MPYSLNRPRIIIQLNMGFKFQQPFFFRPLCMYIGKGKYAQPGQRLPAFVQNQPPFHGFTVKADFKAGSANRGLNSGQNEIIQRIRCVTESSNLSALISDAQGKTRPAALP